MQENITTSTDEEVYFKCTLKSYHFFNTNGH